MKHYASVDDYLAHTESWHDETVRLRAVLLDCGLSEAIKWGKPCYGHGGANLAIIQPFSEFLALLFFKGVLLADPRGVLEEQGENTRAARRVCFRSVDEVRSLADTVRDLVSSAIEVEEQGLALPESEPEALAPELQARLDQDPALKAAFEGLTPGRQRAYNLYISGAKQSATRASRVDRHVERILAGKGLRDR